MIAPISEGTFSVVPVMNSMVRMPPVSTSLASTQSDTPIPGLLSNVATFKRTSVPTNANQTNVQPVYEVYASVQGRDLGGMASEISSG
jgi:Cu/Ag efflux pump CusA